MRRERGTIVIRKKKRVRRKESQPRRRRRLLGDDVATVLVRGSRVDDSLLVTSVVVLEVLLSVELLKSAALGLGDEESGEDTRKHEQSEDLQDMVDPSVLAANILKTGEPDLRDDGTELARGGGDTVARAAVAGGEDFAGDDESGGVGTEVLEEVGEAVQEDEGALGVGEDGVVPEAHDDEDDGEHDEAHELDRLAAPGVDEEEGDPVTGDETSDGDAERREEGLDEVAIRENGMRDVHDVTDGSVEQVVVDLLVGVGGLGSAETDGSEDDRRVQA